jgi:hypothetical protein
MYIKSNNFKIKYPLLSILFIVLFILTAFHIQKSTSVYAVEITPIVNTTSFSSNETDQAGEDTAGHLYWAASGDRSGIEMYLVDAGGHVVWHHSYFDSAGKSMKDDYANTLNYAYAYQKTYAHGGNGNVAINSYSYLANISTVYYDNGWQSKGTEVADWLVSKYVDSNGVTPQITVSGQTFEMENWMNLIIQKSGVDNFGLVIKPLVESVNNNVQWQMFYEPVSVDYLYTNDLFSSSGGKDTNELEYEGGYPIPAHNGTINSNGTGGWTPYVFIADATSFITEFIPTYVSSSGAGDYTWKFYNKQLPFSLCLEEEVKVGTGSADGSSSRILSACTMKVTDITGPSNSLKSSHITDGVGIASIILPISKSPLDTYWEPNGSPGKPEPTDDTTSGDCNIYKSYYTVTTTYDSTGTTITNVEVSGPEEYSEKQTTNYINVMDEASVNGYALKQWATSGSDLAIDVPSPDTEGEIKFHDTSGCKKVSTSPLQNFESEQTYIILILVNEETDQDEDDLDDYFEITESTLTKRVNFSQVTLKLKEATFEWTRNQFDSKAA